MISDGLKKIEEVIARGPFAASWDSLESFEVPGWYEDGKFGIFIHWGVYSVPAFGSEWYPRNMYREGTPEFEHHLKTYGPQREFGYKDFIPMFKAEKFDADKWAELFRKAGARFVMPVAEHHDGFAMYDCGYHNWTAVKMGPKRDIIGELAAAIPKAGMVFTCSSHREQHFWFFDGGMSFDSDVRDLAYRSFYGPALSGVDPDREYLEEWLVYTREIVDKYEPRIVYFDGYINNRAFQPYLQKFAAYYYNRAHEWGRQVAINYKEKAFRDGSAVFDVERGQVAGIRPSFWQCDTSVSKNSWGYITHHDYKSVAMVIGELVDVVSKNGALLLNIGPKSDGTIPEPEERMLLEIGNWLDVNGEAIYGSRPWKTFGEGPTQPVEGSCTDEERTPFTSEDIRFTTKGDVLYAAFLAWPDDGAVRIRSLAKGSVPSIRGAELLGRGRPIDWTQDRDGLKVDLSAVEPSGPVGVLKLTWGTT